MSASQPKQRPKNQTLYVVVSGKDHSRIKAFAAALDQTVGEFVRAAIHKHLNDLANDEETADKANAWLRSRQAADQ